MLEILKKYSFFWIPYGIFLLVAGLILLIFSKAEIHLYINQHYTSWADLMMRTLTYLGDGAAPFVLALVFVFLNVRKALLIAVFPTIAGLFVQLLKHVFFSGVLRPNAYFEAGTLRLVPGVAVHSMFSFPSGHTATIFAMALTLVYISEKKTIHFLLSLLALVTGMTRVYLSQHFLIDVYFGSIVGISVSSILWFLNKKVDYQWLNMPVQGLMKKSRVK